MKTNKRIVSFLLVVCLMLTAMIPAVFAAEGDGVLNYTFGFDDLSGKVEKSSAVNPYSGDPTTNPGYRLTSDNGYYLNISTSRRGLLIGTDYIQARFSADYGIGHWFAVKIEAVNKGTYNMNFKHNKSSSCGKVEIYIVTGENYDSIVGADNFATLTL